MRTVKRVITKNFDVELVNTNHGYEIVVQYLGKVKISENIEDFKIASSLFDLKVQELEGN